ncbi:MAG: hypothetical protein IJ306_07290 [Oscillospiraceae bacterium]|nr:hypothetical protein [Oscillospiraceae bacterium]
MAKKGMKRIEITHTEPRNEAPAVPEISGKAKFGKEKANPIIAGTRSPGLKVYHSAKASAEKPISFKWGPIASDLARDNLENDIPAADLEDL